MNQCLNFLYDGEIYCTEDFESQIRIKDNLCKIFGFPESIELHCQTKTLQDGIDCDSGADNETGFPESLELNWKNKTLQGAQHIQDEADFDGNEILENQNEQGEDIIGAVDNNLTPNNIVETTLVQNSDETLIYNETSSSENEFEAVTITQESFEDIPTMSNTEKVVIIPLRRVRDSNIRLTKSIEIEGNLGNDSNQQDSKMAKSKIFVCDYCSWSCLKKSTLNVHINTMHRNTRHKKPCFNGRLKKDKKLTKSKQAKGETTRPVCNECGSSFTSKKVLRKHFQRIHMKLTPSKKFKCSECEKSYESNGHLKHHLNSVH